MSSDRDVTRIVRSWLRTDEHESADRVLDTVLVLLDTTPQRRPWWPAWRIANMNIYAKLAAAAAAVLVVAVVGLMFFPRNTGVAGPGATPSIKPSASPLPTPTPAPSAAAVFPAAGSLAPGRQSFTENGIAFSMEVPVGWSSSGIDCPQCATNAGWISKGAETTPGAIWMPIWGVKGVASDPCGHVAAPAAASAKELAAAVAGLPGVDVVTPPEDVTVGGRAARHVVIRVRNDIGCAAEQFYMWWDTPGDFRWASAVGQTNRVWVLDLNGRRFWIEAETYKGSSQALETEIQGMIDSIQFD